MPRPKADFPDPAALRALVTHGQLRVRATPGAHDEAIILDGDRVSVKVRAKATDGKANAAVEKLVARALGVSTSRCRMMRGATSRDKVLAVDL